MVWIIDLDGVIWLADRPVAGSPEAVARVRRAGHRVLFLTNNSAPSTGELVAKLTGMGIEAAADDLVTSAMAAATLVESGATALVCGGNGVVEALQARGVRTVDSGPADYVVVGMNRQFDFEVLTESVRAVHRGARLVGTNDDPTYPMPDGPVPGGGAILAAVATAAGVEPEIAGKPYPPMAALVRERIRSETFEGILVGDRSSTDGLMARRLDLPFALVLTGVTTADDLPVEPPPDLVATSLGALVGEHGDVRQELA